MNQLDLTADAVLIAVRDYCAREWEKRSQVLQVHILADAAKYIDAKFGGVFEGKAGLPGERGERGETGPRGEIGPQGDQGIAGRDGDHGVNGEHGPQGPQGERGLIGESGQPGKDGNIGAVGPQGDSGLPGERGEQGPIGEAGLAGKDGAQGIAGDTGERGLTGERGEQGDRGEPGKDGANGAIGPSGERGEKGLIGERGESGVPGLPGRDGQDGHDGQQGRDGMDGRDALAIEVLPSIDETRSYPRGTFATYRHGLVRAFRSTDPITEAGLTLAGWSVVVDGVHDIGVEVDEDARTVAIGSELTSGKVFSKVFRMPVVLDRGVFRQGSKYAKGDGVTWDGCFWIAQHDEPTERPGTAGSTQWRLAVKGGRDGKDGKDGERGSVGAPGYTPQGARS